MRDLLNLAELSVVGGLFYFKIMIEQREDKDRIKCPYCRAFLMEVRPKMQDGQTVSCKCWNCRGDVDITKE